MRGKFLNYFMCRGFSGWIFSPGRRPISPPGGVVGRVQMDLFWLRNGPAAIIRGVMRPLPLILILILLLPVISTSAEMSVLFIGNSHTYFNFLPVLFQDLALAGGHDIYVDQSTPGGYTLAAHTENPTTLAKIAERSWDHVILQDHSLYPAIPWLRENSFFPAAATLDSLIKESGSGTTLFMTWGWELGGEFCIDGHCSPFYPDYESMQQAVTAAYGDLATELGALLVPVGSLWAVALHSDPSSPLWSQDHYHPSPEGSYLAACVFFTRLLEESPLGLEFYGDIDPRRAEFYQEIASRALTGISPEASASGRQATLLPNYPNPFNPLTTITFELQVEDVVTIEIFDAEGALVEKISPGVFSTGRHRVRWEAADLPSGVYLCRLRTGGFTDTRKLTLLR
jgi:hypothetical protein